MQAVGVRGKAHVGVVVNDEGHREGCERLFERVGAVDEVAFFPAGRPKLYDGGAGLDGRKRRRHHAVKAAAEDGIQNEVKRKIKRVTHGKPQRPTV